MTQLSINLNKIALLRNARGRNFPDLLEFAKIVLKSGAIGITMHPRSDQRHARYSDIYELLELLVDFPNKELNIEGYPDDNFMKLVLDVKPHQCTLVPDTPDQITSDHGWDLVKNFNFVSNTIKQLKKEKIRTSLFMDPIPETMTLAAQCDTDRVELYTEKYAENYGNKSMSKILGEYKKSANRAQHLGLGVNAGHDLNLENLGRFISEVDYIQEVSIGHALIVESLHFGFIPTIQQYMTIIRNHNV